MFRSAVAVSLSSLAGCVVHEASLPPGWSRLPDAPRDEHFDLIAGLAAGDSNRPSAGFAVSGRVDDFGFAMSMDTGLDDAFQGPLPEVVGALSLSYLPDPLRLDLDLGLTEASLFAGLQLRVAGEHALDDHWFVRGAGGLFAVMPLGANCGGEFVHCDDPDDEVSPTSGVTGGGAFGARIGELAIVVGPSAQWIVFDGRTELVWGGVLQLEVSWEMPRPPEQHTY